MEELLEKLKEKLLSRECSLESLALEFGVSDKEIMGYVRILKARGENINVAKKSDGIYIENFGDNTINNHNTKTIINDEEEYKILLISDTRLCSQFEQISILNNIFHKQYIAVITDLPHCLTARKIENLLFCKCFKYSIW